MKFRSSIPAILFLVVSGLSASAQNIEDMVSKYTDKNGKGYMQPLANAFGASLNSGLFHNAHLKKMGFQMYIGMQTTAAFIPEKYKTFDATTEGGFAPKQTTEVSTIFGSTESTEVNGDGGTVYVFPGGLNVTMIPFAVPQLTIGSVFGTDVTVRYFGYSLNDDVGNLKLFSWGIRHSINQYIPLMPLDLAVGFYDQSFKLGDIVECNSWCLNAQASKSLLIFTFYGGLGYERSKMNISYTSEEDDTDVEFDLIGSNKIRINAGITFNLGPVKLNVDYSLAKQSVLCAGLGIGINEK
jgi:hypothetical protein